MHVRANVAVSADGKLSTRRREQLAISGERDFERVHQLRAEADAILVGVGTVVADDPSLLAHDEARRAEIGKGGSPARIVADSTARTPRDASILDGPAATTLLVAEAAGDDRLDTLRGAGADVVTAGEDRVDLAAAFDRLAERGVEDLLVEGGGELLFSLFDARLVDDLTVYVGPLVVGGADAPTLADGEGFVKAFPRLELRDVDRLDGGVLLSWSVEG